MADTECPMCGETIKAAAKKCRHCGEFLDEGLRAEREGEEEPDVDPTLAMIVPINATVLSIAASYLGLFTLLGCFPIAPVTLIVSILALKDLKTKPKASGKARAIFGLVVGVLCSLALVAFAVVFALDQ